MKKNRILKISFCIVLISLTTLLAFLSTKKTLTYTDDSYYNNTKEKQSIKLSPSKSLSDNFVYTISKVEKFIVPVDSSVFNGAIKFQILADGKKVFEKNITSNDINENLINLDFKEITLDKDDIFTVKIKNETDSVLRFEGYKDKKIDTNLNKEYEVTRLNAAISGASYSFHYGYINALIIIIVLFCIAYYFKNRKLFKRNFIHKIIHMLNKYKIQYIFEVILFFIVVLSLLGNYIDLYFFDRLNILFLFIFISLFIFAVVYIVELLYEAKGNIQKYFLIIAIPLSIFYLLLIVPNAVPDEFVHFVKTYATSNFDFSTPATVDVPSSLVREYSYNYLTFFQQLFDSTNYSSLSSASTAGYNFILYLIPSFGIMIGRLLNFSIMFSYLLARLFNASLFIFVGYWSIKTIPFGKRLLLVYLLSPMMIQQSCSLSPDCLINLVSLFSIAYLLNLYKRDNEIVWKDILILGFLVIIIIVTKYVYLPIFGLVFLSFKKMKVMGYKKWLTVVAIVLIGFAIYYYFSIYLPSLIENNYANDYLLANNVNQSEQLSLIVNQPIYFAKVLLNTWNVMGQFYMTSAFLSPLSWLTIFISERIFYFYILILIIAICIEENKYKFKIIEKLWILFLVSIMILGICFTLYLSWTPVGGQVVLGIQGRYFIPIIILLLMLFTGSKKISLKYPNLTIISFLLVVHYVTLNTVLEFFKYVNM